MNGAVLQREHRVNTMEQDKLAPEQITSQLNRILASSGFARSERHSRFLGYIVDHAISGRLNRLKGYTIGIDVFDRDASFDPTVDSIVRVEAGRLRTKLHEYYRAEGQNDPLIIDLPKGAYLPVFYLNRSAAAARGGKDAGVDNWVVTRKPVASIGVLPLVNLSSGGDLEYFSDGITESIINELAKIPELRVISLTSMMCFKGTRKTIREIAAQLEVSHVLEGTVLKEEERARITVQLIEGSSDHNIWAESYERELDNIIQLQGELSRSIAEQLAIELRPPQESAGTVNREALEAYLIGRRYRNELTVEGYYRAREYFQEALSKDPRFAQAYMGIASCYCSLGSHGFEIDDPRDIIPQGLSNAQTALLLDESLHEAHAFMGIMLLKYSWDWTGSEYSFRRALELNPNDPRATMQYSMYFETLGRHDKAVQLAEAAHAVDPLSKAVNFNLAWQHFQAGNYPRALELFRELVKMHPDFWGGHWGIAHVFRETGAHDEAVRSFQRAVLLSGGYALPYQGLGHIYGITGRHREAMKAIEELERRALNTYVSPYYFATIYAGLGDFDKCFDWLEKAYEYRSRLMAWLNVAKEYRPVHSDPRYRDLISRIGIPVEVAG